MFLTLLLVTFAVSLGTAALLAGLFRDPVDKILARIIADDISSAWRRYITFAIYVTGVSGGVRIWDLEDKKIVAELVPESTLKSKPVCTSIAWSADGNTLYSGFTDNTIREWGVHSKK